MERFSSWKPSIKKTLDEYIEGLENKREIIVEVDWEDEPLKNKIIPLCGTNPFTQYKFDTDKTASMIMNVFFSEKEIWGTRSRNHISITDDMFYWLFKRFKSYNEEELSPSSDLFITGLEGYMAKTREDRNVFRGVGHRVGAMLGTLAYLLSYHELRSLKPELQHDSQIFKLEISSQNSFTILDGGYDGRLNYTFSGRDFEKMNNIIIYIDLYIIPKLISAYKENIEQNLWSRQFKLDFLKDIGEEISERVNAEVEKIQREIDELENCDEDDNLDDMASDFKMSDDDMFNELR